VGEDVEQRFEGFGRAALRAGQIEDQRLSECPRFAARQVSTRCLLVTPQANQFHQSSVATFEYVERGFGRHIARGEARAAGGQDQVGSRIVQRPMAQSITQL